MDDKSKNDGENKFGLFTPITFLFTKAEKVLS